VGNGVMSSVQTIGKCGLVRSLLYSLHITPNPPWALTTQWRYPSVFDRCVCW
jgi:hypothetical protein